MRPPANPAWLAMAKRAWRGQDEDGLRQQLETMGAVLSIEQELHAQGQMRNIARLLVERAGEVQATERVIVALRQQHGDPTFEIFDSEAGEAPHDVVLLSDLELLRLADTTGPFEVSLGVADALPAYLAPLASAGLRSATVVPLGAGQEPLAVLVLAHAGRRGDTPPLSPYFTALAEAGALALDNARQMEDSRTQAKYDHLTGLPNRRIFFDRLEGVLSACDRHGHAAAFCFVDLDGFKRVNDTMGHTVGDRVIRQVAQRLVSSLRQSDSICRGALADLASSGATHDADAEASEDDIARLGGDEFAVLLSKIADPKDATLVAKRIMDAFEKPFDLDGGEVYLSASIGIATYPLDGRDADSLLRNADTAMYCAKQRGKNCFQFYASAMNAEASRRLHIETRLRSALERGEFEVFYQQQRDARSGRLVGAEALLRWDDPEMGMVSPAEFIPLAEQTGCITPIGEFVLRSVCAQLREWRERGYGAIRTAVNLSPCQLRQDGFVETLAAILEESQVSPGQLELEITESAIIGEDEMAFRTVERLGAMGFSLVLDDFGTGYSSLSYLRRFNPDGLKIDRSFVRELPANQADCSLNTAILSMARGLGLRVVAEGVETEEQASYLREKGCDELQGFLFGRPIPVERFEEILEREKAEDER